MAITRQNAPVQAPPRPTRSGVPAGLTAMPQVGVSGESSVPESGGGERSAPAASSLPIKTLLMFTRQMAMLLSSGSAVVPALTAMSRQLPKAGHRALIRHLRAEVEGGATLTDAIRKYPHAFDPVYCALISAGEASATLPETFKRLAGLINKRRTIRNRVLGAMGYPALLVLLSVGIVSILLFFVIPRFAGLFSTLQVPLPMTTSAMIAIADAVSIYWYVPVVAVTAAIAGVIVTTRTDGGRQWLADIQIRVPVAGHLASRLIQARAFRVVGLLIESHVSVLEAIELARQVTRNRRYQETFDGMNEAVTSGKSMSGSLHASGLVAPAICQAIATGEESGNMGEAISFAADVLDDENDELIQTVVKLVEPMILIGMGIVIGIVAVSLFMPLFDVTAAVQ